MFDLPDEDILPLSKEHVFWTWSAQARVNPLAVKRAKGVYFWDVDDKRYLDFNSMTMCVNIGHGDERVINAMKAQLDEIPYAAPGMTTRIRALASQTVAGLTPGGKLSKVLFTLGGADANENALKLARGYTGRHKILSRYRSYHGATAGAMAATGDPRRVAWEPNLMPGVVHFLDRTAIAPPSTAPTRASPKPISHWITSTTWKRSSVTRGPSPSLQFCSSR
jgi:taurine--2-oxoglutarate transaminase